MGPHQPSTGLRGLEGQEAYIWGHMKARGTYSPGPKGPQCVGGRRQRGTDIPISGAGSDAAGDANDVPPPPPATKPAARVPGAGKRAYLQNLGSEWELSKKQERPSKKRGAVYKASK